MATKSKPETSMEEGIFFDIAPDGDGRNRIYVNFYNAGTFSIEVSKEEIERLHSQLGKFRGSTSDTDPERNKPNNKRETEISIKVPKDIGNQGDIVIDALVEAFSDPDSENESREEKIDEFNQRIDDIISEIVKHDGKTIVVSIKDTKSGTNLMQKPGCYSKCPFDDLCANDIEKVRAVETEAANEVKEGVHLWVLENRKNFMANNCEWLCDSLEDHLNNDSLKRNE